MNTTCTSVKCSTMSKKKKKIKSVFKINDAKDTIKKIFYAHCFNPFSY